MSVGADATERFGGTHADEMVGVVQGLNQSRDGGAGIGTEAAQGDGGRGANLVIGVGKGLAQGGDGGRGFAAEDTEGAGRLLAHSGVGLAKSVDPVTYAETFVEGLGDVIGPTHGWSVSLGWSRGELCFPYTRRPLPVKESASGRRRDYLRLGRGGGAVALDDLDQGHDRLPEVRRQGGPAGEQTRQIGVRRGELAAHRGQLVVAGFFGHRPHDSAQRPMSGLHSRVGCVNTGHATQPAERPQG